MELLPTFTQLLEKPFAREANTHCILLLGPPASGKTSLLFEYAYKMACEGKKVVFVCNKPKLESSPPYLLQVVAGLVENPDFDESTFNSSALELITFHYVLDDVELNLFFANIHTRPLPDSLIIDDLLSVPCKSDMLCSHSLSLALLIDTVYYLDKRGDKLNIISCISNERFDASAKYYEYYFDKILMIRGQANPRQIIQLQ